jgi:hypothetical protein
MRLKLGVLFFLVIASLSLVYAACPAGMSAYWQFNESSGAAVNKILPGTHDGTVYGGAARVTGKLGNAIKLDGIDDYVSFANSGQNNPDFNFQENDFTIEFWALSAFPSNTTAPTAAYSSPIYQDFSFVITSTCPGFSFYDKNKNYIFAYNSTACYPSFYNDMKWHYFVFKREGDLLSFFKDGKSVITDAQCMRYVSGSQWNGCGAVTVNNGKVDLSTAPGFDRKIYPSTLNIEAGGGGLSFNGSIDEVAVYKQALSDSEIATHYNYGFGTDYCSTPNWTCSNWSECSSEGQQTGTCIDGHGNSRIGINPCSPGPGTPGSSCSGNDDVIMKLYYNTNSHGALWNVTSYPEEIKYSDFLGAYSGECSKAHDCTGSNKVVFLNKISNSHVSSAYSTSYTISVCYGDLSCSAQTSKANCDSLGGTIVASLSSSTNAHIAKGDFAGYDTKICCKKTLTAGDLAWTAMDKETSGLETADRTDSVKLVWKNINLADIPAGTKIDFKIYEDDTLLNPDDYIRTVTAVVKNVGGVGKAVASWKITDTDWNAGGNEDIEEFYFQAYNNNTGIEYNGKKSGILGVDKNSFDNSPPSVSILYPNDGMKFLFDTPIDFNLSVSDPDDDVEVFWNFKDTSTENIKNCQTENICNTTHVYSSSNYGTKIVKAEVREMDRTPYQQGKDTKEIFIYREKLNIFSRVIQPLKGEIVQQLPAYIQVNGDGSFIANCTLNTCPSSIPDYAVTQSCYDVRNSTVSYKCFDLNNSLGIPEHYTLWFNWTFIPEGGNVFGEWVDSNTYKKYVNFSKLFTIPGTHTISLRVGFEPQNM